METRRERGGGAAGGHSGTVPCRGPDANGDPGPRRPKEASRGLGLGLGLRCLLRCLLRSGAIYFKRSHIFFGPIFPRLVEIQAEGERLERWPQWQGCPKGRRDCLSFFFTKGATGAPIKIPDKSRSLLSEKARLPTQGYRASTRTWYLSTVRRACGAEKHHRLSRLPLVRAEPTKWELDLRRRHGGGGGGAWRAPGAHESAFSGGS